MGDLQKAIRAAIRGGAIYQLSGSREYDGIFVKKESPAVVALKWANIETSSASSCPRGTLSVDSEQLVNFLGEDLFAAQVESRARG